MLKEHDRIVLTEGIPRAGLEAGDVGTIVHVYRNGAAFEVEFLALDGDTVAVETVPAPKVRVVSPRDITHARHMERAA
jgi:hypothetical protein